MTEPTTQQMQVRIDESKMNPTYANAFRNQSTPYEVIIDTGINVIVPANELGEGQRQMKFQIDNRLVMNYPTAKRLSMMLNGIVQNFEQQNGEIKLEQGPA